MSVDFSLLAGPDDAEGKFFCFKSNAMVVGVLQSPKNTERETKTAAKRTGRRSGTVEELLTGEAVAPEVRTQFAALDHETRIVLNLVEMRQSAGLTQQKLAEMTGKTQGAISKLESSTDDEITIRELCEYAKAAPHRTRSTSSGPHQWCWFAGFDCHRFWLAALLAFRHLIFRQNRW